MRLWIGTAIIAVLLSPSPAQAADQAWLDCRGSNVERSISGCTQVLARETRENPSRRAFAFGSRGFAYMQTSDYDGAIADYDQAIRLDPDEAIWYNNRGRAYNRKGDFDRAIADLDQAIQLNPKFANAFVARGFAYNEKADYDRAIADLDKTIRLNPSIPGSYEYRGFAYTRKGEYDRAIADLDQAIRLAPKLARPHFHRGVAFEKKDDLATALAAYDAALRLDQAENDALAGRARVLSAIAKSAGAPSVVTAGREPDPVPLAPALSGIATPAGRRAALVIGNSAYRHAAPLPNPSNDAADIASALRGLGFHVIEGHDLDAYQLRIAVRDFTRSLEGADLALLFYAGHAVQVGGRNYVVPVDADLKSTADLDFSTVDVGSMEGDSRVSLVFLDACRDNPFSRSLRSSIGTRSTAVGQGLAPIAVAPASGAFGKTAGTLIAFATQPDNIALDGRGRNSPFTAALLNHIRTPGLEIEQLLRRVRTEVASATQGKQIPRHDSGIVGGDVVLAAAKF